MSVYNKVMLIGNVTRDPELKKTPAGVAFCEVSIAINKITMEAGAKRESVLFLDVDLWGRNAEVACEYAKKGRPVYLEGRLRMQNWKDSKSGANRSRLRIAGESLKLLGGKPSQDTSAATGGQQTAYPQAIEEIPTNDIPF